jgi:hypothetical protein
MYEALSPLSCKLPSMVLKHRTTLPVAVLHVTLSLRVEQCMGTIFDPCIKPITDLNFYTFAVLQDQILYQTLPPLLIQPM